MIGFFEAGTALLKTGMDKTKELAKNAAAVTLSIVVKREMLKYVADAREKLTKINAQFESSTLVQHTPEFKTLSNDLLKKTKNLLNDIELADNVDSISLIVAKVIVNDISLNTFTAFVSRLKESASGTKLLNFLSTLIDLEQYQSLIEQVKNIEDIKNLKVDQQRTFYRSLSDSKLTEQMRTDLSCLDIDRVKSKTTKYADPVCDHFKLSTEDKQTVIGIFDKLSDKHLPLLKEAQAALVQHMPFFLASAKELIVNNYPYLAIEDAAPSLTPALDNVVSANSEESTSSLETQAPEQKQKLAL